MNTAAARRDVTSKYSRSATLYICFGNDYRVALTTKQGDDLCTGKFADADGVEVVETDHRGDVLHFASGVKSVFITSTGTLSTDDAMRSLGYVVSDVKRAAKATLVTLGDMGFGHNVLYARDLEIRLIPHAQYSQAVEVSYIPRGSRKRRGFVQSYGANVVALDGWVAVGKRDAFESMPSSQPGVTVQRSRDTAFGETWATERDQAVAAAVKSGARIIADYRGHNAH